MLGVERQSAPLHVGADVSLNGLEVVKLRLADKSDGGAGPAHTASPTDAMYVLFDVLRRVEVNNPGDGWDVQAAGRQVGGNQQLQATGAEGAHHSIALTLGSGGRGYL